MSLHSIVEGWLWVAFLVAVVTIIFVDLIVFHRKAHAMAIKEALLWSGFWVVLALCFNVWFGFQYGSGPGLEFLTGYLVELSLSVDNLFVMLLIFKSFHIQPKYQHRVLFWGILGAIVFRAIFILVGVELIHRFEWLLYVFGVILVVSAVKFIFETDEAKDVKDTWAVRLFEKVIPISKHRDHEHFIVREDGVRKATTLLLVLFLVEITDIIFAVDSIPAVLAVTKDGFIAFASNILALLGLRSMYFVIADWVGRFRYLKPGLATVLAFVGVKMLFAKVFHIPSWVSLMVIVFILTTAGLSSWYVSRKSILKD